MVTERERTEELPFEEEDDEELDFGTEDEDDSDEEDESNSDEEEDDDLPEAVLPVDKGIPETEVDLSDPRLRGQLEHIFRGWVAEADQERQKAERLREIERLVSSDSPEDRQRLGQFFANTFVAERNKREIGAEVLKQEYMQTMAELFQHEAFENLTAEQKAQLHPSRYQTDRQYIGVLQKFIWNYENSKAQVQSAARRQNVQESVAVKRATAERSQKASVSNLPSGGSPSPSGRKNIDVLKTPGRDLLREGLREIIGTK
jgi:hypothetical protein